MRRRLMAAAEPVAIVVAAIAVIVLTSVTPGRLSAASAAVAGLASALGVAACGARLVARMRRRSCLTARSRLAAANAATAACRAKDEFLTNMSHELRTPLTAIIGYTEMLRTAEVAGSPGLGRDDVIDALVRNGQHLLALIDDMLDYSLLETGGMTIVPAEMDLGALVAEVMSTFAPRAADRGIGLVAMATSDVPGRIRCDASRLRQILENLVGNAVKFTHKGRVIVSLRAGRVADATSQPLIIAVTDTGIGMSHAQVQRLFQPFTQADMSLTRRYGGTGLGLCICERLARALGCELHVTSTLGHGSTFTLVIREPHPCGGEISAGTLLGSHIGAEAASTPPASAKPLAGMRILLAEDGPDNRRLIAHLIRTAGGAVTLAEDGAQAIAAMATADNGQCFDLVLMDMQMPEVDGYDAARHLRSLGIETPIVALTAHALAGDREKCLAAGCDDYLTKPIQAATLISACLQHRRARRRAAA